MSDRCPLPVACSVIIILLLACAGCTSTTIGDVAYNDGSLNIGITSHDGGGDAYIQVTVYEIKNFHQQEMQYLQQPVTLAPGSNTVQVPVTLPPGTYKLYVYILKPGERETATIRDITV